MDVLKEKNRILMEKLFKAYSIINALFKFFRDKQVNELKDMFEAI